MHPNDLASLKAAFHGLDQTFERVRRFSGPVAALQSGFDGVDPHDLLKAAAAHAIAAAALAGLVRQLVARETGAVPEAVLSFGPDKESEEQR